MALSKTSVNNFSSLLIDNLVEIFRLSKNPKLTFESIPNSSEQKAVLKHRFFCKKEIELVLGSIFY